MPKNCNGRSTGQLHWRGATQTWARGNLREKGPTNTLCSYANVGSTMYSTGASNSFSSCHPPQHHYHFHKTSVSKLHKPWEIKSLNNCKRHIRWTCRHDLQNECFSSWWWWWWWCQFEEYLDAFICWSYWSMDPQTPWFQLDYCHAYVCGHISKSQSLLLLEHPYQPLLNLP